MGRGDRKSALGDRGRTAIAGRLHVSKTTDGASGRARELVPILDSAQRRSPEIEVGRFRGFVIEQCRAIADGIPSILLITLPKSGSVYTTTRLSKKLGAPQCRISLDLTPIDHVVPSWAESFARGGAVCQEHLDASPDNLEVLAASGVKKLQIHVRDPRQATISWIHHVETMVDENSYLRDLSSPALPDDYDERSFSEKIDWHIDNHLPALAKWSAAWLAASSRDDLGIAMRFSLYEDFHHDQTAFFADLLEFFGVYGFDIRALSSRSLERNGLHFRRGEVDEWRRVFSAEQCTRATDAIPKDLGTRFMWLP
jgi:hypothetical protein